jgi:hypothetical protein
MVLTQKLMIIQSSPLPGMSMLLTSLRKSVPQVSTQSSAAFGEAATEMFQLA